MADFSKFRSSLNGFNRSDVAEYIETLCAEHQKALKTAQDDAADLAQKLTQQTAQNEALKTELDTTRTALESTQSALEEAMEALTNPEVPEEASVEEEPAPDYENLELEKQLDAELERYLKELAEKNKSNYVGGVMGWPLPIDVNYYVSSEQGWRKLWGMDDYHLGIDLACAMNTDIYAANAGEIVTSTYHNSYGNYVVIDHGGGKATLYAHMNQRLVNVGDKVEKGQLIGKVGTTGSSSGYHLHFEVRENGEVQNPRNYINLP